MTAAAGVGGAGELMSIGGFGLEFFVFRVQPDRAFSGDRADKVTI